MKKWLQQLMIGLVAFLTLGLINPTHDIWNHFSDRNESSKEDIPSHENQIRSIPLTEPLHQTNIEESIEIKMNQFVFQAKERSYEKFGTKILPVIQHRFDQEVFPLIDQQVRSTISQLAKIDQGKIVISGTPAGNYGEKIFHVYHEDTQKDLIQFHVRIEKRPQDGYYFNFHYHLEENQYQEHYQLGDIYWSKNQPPKWLS